MFRSVSGAGGFADQTLDPRSAAMKRMFYELARFCAENAVPTESLRVILNFTDREAAARFDIAFKRSLEPLMLRPSHDFDIRKFEMNGIKGMVESPIHETPN